MSSSKLYKIYEDLNRHKRNRSEVFERAVIERLSDSLESYMHSLNASKSFFTDKNELNVLKGISRRL